VYGFVRTFVKDSDSAEDVTQEIFVKVWKYLGRYNPAQSFRPWLYTIAKRTALDFLKKKQLVPFSELENEDGLDWLSQTVVDSGPSPDALVQSGFEQRRVSSALESLSPSYADVVSLHHREGLKFREIADTLGQPLNTVKSQYRRALAQLKNLLVP
jgi:RNA polymerase sigma-70 factor (ECF subfamily)